MERATHAFGPLEVGIGRLVGGAVVLAVVWWVQRIGTAWRCGTLHGLQAWPWLALPCPLRFSRIVYRKGSGTAIRHDGWADALATIVVSVPLLGVWPTGGNLLA